MGDGYRMTTGVKGTKNEGEGEGRPVMAGDCRAP